VWRVPSDDMAKLRSLAALPKSTTADVTARRCAVARAVDGKLSREIARQLGAMRHDDA
jgi:DNA-binding NarL/FixJ family response regulator